MTLFDFLLLIAIFGFMWFGFWFGAIHMVGGLIGTIAGSWLAGHYYDTLSLVISNILGINSPWLNLICFIKIFVLVNRLIGFIFYILDKTFGFLSRLPFIKTIDRLGGLVFGLLEAVMVIGLTLYFASRLPLPMLFENAVAASRVAQRLITMASVLVPLLPDIIRKVQPYIPNIDLPIPGPS